MNQNVSTTNTVVKTPIKTSDNWKTASAWGAAIAAVGAALAILGNEMSKTLSSRGR